MVVAVEKISNPQSRRRFLRSGLGGFRTEINDQKSLITDQKKRIPADLFTAARFVDSSGLGITQKSVQSGQSVVPESTVPPVPMSIAHKPRSGLCLGGEDPLLLPDMPILRHRHLGSCLDIDRCSLVIERSADPTKEQGGDENLYRYTNNDPVNNLDPSGHKHHNHHVYHPPQTQQHQQHNPQPHETSATLDHTQALQQQIVSTQQRNEDLPHQPPTSDNTAPDDANEKLRVTQQAVATVQVDYETPDSKGANASQVQAEQPAQSSAKSQAATAAKPSRAEQEALGKYYALAHTVQQLRKARHLAFYKRHPHAMKILQAEIAAARVRLINAYIAFHKQYHTTPEEVTRGIEEGLSSAREKLEKAIKYLKHAHDLATIAGKDAVKLEKLGKALENVNVAINALHGLIAAASTNPVTRLKTVTDALNIAATLLNEAMPGVGSMLSAYAKIVGAMGGAIQRGIVDEINKKTLGALLHPTPGWISAQISRGTGSYSEIGVKETIREMLSNRKLMREYPGLKQYLEQALRQLNQASK